MKSVLTSVHRDAYINWQEIPVRQVDSVPNAGCPAVGELYASDNSFQRPDNVRAGRGLFIKSAVLFLLVTVVSLSTLAKASRCLPQSNPSRYLSQVSKMREPSIQRLSDRQTLNRDSADRFHSKDEAGVSFSLGTEQPLPKSSATLNTHQLRSPPADFS
jgi:hypothetical protein